MAQDIISQKINALVDRSTGAFVGHLGYGDAKEYALPGLSFDSSGTPGAATQNSTKGRAAIAVGASSVVITNRFASAGMSAFAVISQASADATATQVVRVSVSAGNVTIFVNANATAATVVDWTLFGAIGS